MSDFTSVQQRCEWCGQPALPMMTVCGPMPFRGGAARRAFCSLRCFWAWVEREREEREEGFNLGEAVSGPGQSEVQSS